MAQLLTASGGWSESDAIAHPPWLARQIPLEIPARTLLFRSSTSQVPTQSRASGDDYRGGGGLLVSAPVGGYSDIVFGMSRAGSLR
jgi:hypothetical protein